MRLVAGVLLVLSLLGLFLVSFPEASCFLMTAPLAFAELVYARRVRGRISS